MSTRFPCACPRAKQIVGQKNWIGYAGSFQFPGFRGNWVNTYGPYGEYTGGAWQETADGGAINPASAEWNFAVGDLVVQEFRAEGPFTDYLTGLVQSYPKYYQVYICASALTGSATRPSDDASHFTPWDFQVFNVVSGTLHADAGEPPGGPSGWPVLMGQRMVGGAGTMNGDTTTSAQLELTMTTELDNFPLYPATLSGLEAALGMSNDTAAAFADPTVPETSASGTFAYTWTFANNYDGTAATYTPPGAAPSVPQAGLIFPKLPYRRNVGYEPAGHWNGGVFICDSVFIISPSPPAAYLPGLVSWSFSALSVSFEFAAWSWDSDVEYSAELGHFGALATAPGTITQTLTLGGAAYTLANVASQAAALRDAITFDSIAWRTSWTNTYSPTGAVVSTPSTPSTALTSVPEAGEVGTHIPWAVAANGCPWTAGAMQYFSTKALVDVCGNYCARTYQEGTSGPVACANGNVDGYAPFTLAPPGTAGQSAAVYAGQC